MSTIFTAVKNFYYVKNDKTCVHFYCLRVSGVTITLLVLKLYTCVRRKNKQHL